LNAVHWEMRRIFLYASARQSSRQPGNRFIDASLPLLFLSKQLFNTLLPAQHKPKPKNAFMVFLIN